MAFRMRKHYQRKLNSLVRKINRSIAEDPLWLGRIEMRQRCSFFETFPDKSGGILRAIIRLYDKKTGLYKDFILEYAPQLRSASFHLWLAANNFLIEDLNVWAENPRPSVKSAFDFSTTPIPEEVMREELKFWL